MTTTNNNNPPLFQERSFEFPNGIVLAAKHWKTGGPSAQTRDTRRFLAFHGFLDNASSFDLLAPLMLQQLGPEPVEIVALDFAGHGKSSNRQTEDYSIWRYAEDAVHVANQLGWDRHAVIGHSMGGAVACLYSGLFVSRVTLCILLDNFGPFTRLVEDQPDHLLEHIQQKKDLPNKQLPFHPTIESAVLARNKNGAYGLNLPSSWILVPRGLRPLERTDSDGTIVKGWTWSTDQLLTIRSAQSLSEEYVQSFMTRIRCPFLAVLASKGIQTIRYMVDDRLPWLCQTKVTIRDVDGNHHVHMEDAPMVAGHVCDWILRQDDAPVARL
ncbi:alpha/beta-hydrolase [Linnemannia elongata AG-77]|uniref:Alpha/beta-hydrolase n=1 Tax=Linnemannia elongata AG-77 TaxID=1314771 RepID=A0A197JRX4_9FUNG|nr:alpha/beta-hydrolase [Linnemannia elongata AG-77]